MIAGVRKHAKAIDAVGIGAERLDAAGVIARFQAHLDTIEDIANYDKLKSDAIAREAKQEAEILELWGLVGYFARGQFGEESTTVRDFGLKERRRTAPTAATKALAVAKRNETRRVRRTMGKNQRKKIKGGL
ncbi:MAG TPA: hypothetical protein VGL81_10240 [Polyangiaceae bacterium]|jgi:hypothetical protein